MYEQYSFSEQMQLETKVKEKKYIQHGVSFPCNIYMENLGGTKTLVAPKTLEYYY